MSQSIRKQNIMNPGDGPLPLASHLRRLAHFTAGEYVGYEFTDSTSCNCGLLARIITGLPKAQFDEKLERISEDVCDWPPLWAHMAAEVCPLNGNRPMVEILAELHDAGLVLEDYSDLENLNNPVVVERALTKLPATSTVRFLFWERTFSLQYLERDNISHVTAYCLAWAELIEEFHGATAKTPTDAELEAQENRPLV